MRRNLNEWCALILGTGLLLLGILGFLQDPLFGVIGVNAAQNGTHIILGAILVAAGAWGGARTARYVDLAVGASLILLGTFGFSDVLARALDLTPASNLLHVILGVGSTMVGIGTSGR